ncbi:MAG: hypothetical protein RI957_327 [Verrucomicrobiota bacterium]|jgi:HEAT repeat protein
MKATFLFFLSFATLTFAQDDREVTEEQQAAVQNGGDIILETIRPENLTDLTKGEGLPPSKNKPFVYHFGPTGISGYMSGGAVGDQILVKDTIKGSPADGKFLPGDVITGMNGVKFQAGGNLGLTIGNAVIEAEREVNSGKITFQVWRDKNYPARTGAKNIAGTDIDQLINEVTADDSLYDWKADEERKEEVKNMDLKKYPLDPITLEIELKLRTFPEYADSAPYDCPKTKQILEEAWKSLEKKFVADPKNPRAGKGGVIEAMALVASGKPEHREIVKQWVRSKNCPWQPPTEPIGAIFEPGNKSSGGKLTWHYGYVGLYCALYYDATGDDYVLPALRKYAIEAAMGQSKSGSWGHTFAFPSFNGGRFHEMNPGYGALNAAGNRCFFLIALAKKLGVEHPEIDAAIVRAHKFFGSYVDQGAIPYGDHIAADTDDSNGKNAGTAFAMKLIGDDHAAKYFGMMSAHASFTPRGGHAHDYFTQWSSWGASLCGPDIRAMAERNMRWRRTLCRMYDGSFVYHSPSEKYGTLHDPTATEVFHQAVILKQTLITGKDVDEKLYPTERETKQLLASAYGQLNNDHLKKLAGKPWQERSTDELLDLLDIFIPKTRKQVAAELGKRLQAGETAIVPRLVELLGNQSARFRHGALTALDACGNETILSNLSKVTPLLSDSADFVRIVAVKVVAKASVDHENQLALLQTAVAERTALAPNSVRNALQESLLKSESPLGKTPFQAGLDETLVEQALTNLILEETGGGPFVGSKIKVWDKDTVIRLAGPLTFIAEEEQVYDQMFAARNAPAQAMLSQFGYLEGIQTNAHRIRVKAEIPRRIRGESGFKDPIINPALVLRQPGAFADLTDEIKTALIANPIEEIEITDETNKFRKLIVPLSKVLITIEQNKNPATLPSIADDVKKLFLAELNAAGGTGAKIKLCRDALAHPENKHTFRQIAAMDALVELLEVEALEYLLPYLGSDYWRTRDHSRALAVTLVRSGGGASLIGLFAKTKSPETQAGLLTVLATAKHTAASALAKDSLKHESATVRAAAAQAFAALSGANSIPDLIAHLIVATERVDAEGCENALAPFCDNPSTALPLRDALLKTKSSTPHDAKFVIFYLLARIGDEKSLAALKKLGEQDDPQLLNAVASAISYSPSRAADRVMLDLAAASPKRAAIVAPHSVRRMVIGPNGYNDITSSVRMDFADAMLAVILEPKIIKLLGSIHEARALNTLMMCLKKGVSSAAESLISNAEGMENLNAADKKVAAKALQDVIEYIEVTRLRGGIKAHMDKDDKYTEWQALQARAGKALLKFHRPETSPVPQFDDLDFDR